jgi:two-component system response regulator HydG
MVVVDMDGILDLDDLPPELLDMATSSEDTTAGGPIDLVGRPLAEIERWAVEQTLQLTGGNREDAARILGIGARTLYRKLKEYELQ